MPEAVTTRTRDALTHAWSASALRLFVSPLCPPSAPPPPRGVGGIEQWLREGKSPSPPPGREGWGDGAGRGGEVTLCGPNQQPADRVQAVATHLVPAAVHRRGEAHGLRALAPPGELRRVMEHQDRAVARGDRFRWRCDRVRYRERESGVGVIPCGKRRQVGRVGGRRRSSFTPDMTDHQEIWMNQARWRDSWVAVRKLPGGGQGNAWRVRRKRDDRDGFLKAIKAKRDPERRARFSREANAYGTRLTFRGDAPLWQNAGHDMVQGQRRRLHLRPVGQSRAAPPRIRCRQCRQGAPRRGQRGQDARLRRLAYAARCGASAGSATLQCLRKSRMSYANQPPFVEFSMLRQKLRCLTGSDNSCRGQTEAVTNARSCNPGTKPE